MRRYLLYPAAFVLLATLLFYPLRTALPNADDFFFITLVRQLEEPWRLLVQDSLGLYFFRPVVMFFWWLTDALFGYRYAAHYLTNIAVHLGCAAAVFVLARGLAISLPVAAAAAIAFAVHPTPVSAAAWLSDRFDLFAALFGLVSLVFVQRFLARGSRACAAGAIAMALVAMLSKETGFAFPAIGMVMLAWAEPCDPLATRKARIGLGAALAVTALGALAFRMLALRTEGDSLFFAGGLAATLARGMLNWSRFLPDFIVAEIGSAAAVFTWLAILVILLLAALRAAWRRAYDRPLGRAIAIGLMLMLLVALAQSPVVGASRVYAYHLAGRPADSVLFDWVVSNRYYYLSLAGFFIVLGAIAEGVRRSLPAWGMRAAAAVSVVAGLAIVALLSGARAAGRDWTHFTRTHDAAIIRAGVEAFGQKRWPAGCKIFLLGTQAYSKHFIYASDTTLKYSLPAGHSLMGCLVQTEVTPWFHIADRRRVTSVAPLEVITHRGKPYPPLEVGNLGIYYLRIPDTDAVRQDPNSLFFEYDGQRFVEVTEAVREGKRPVRFFDNRPPG